MLRFALHSTISRYIRLFFILNWYGILNFAFLVFFLISSTFFWKIKKKNQGLYIYHFNIEIALCTYCEKGPSKYWKLRVQIHGKWCFFLHNSWFSIFVQFEKPGRCYDQGIPSVFNRSCHPSTQIFLQLILYPQPIKTKKNV